MDTAIKVSLLCVIASSEKYACENLMKPPTDIIVNRSESTLPSSAMKRYRQLSSTGATSDSTDTHVAMAADTSDIYHSNSAAVETVRTISSLHTRSNDQIGLIRFEVPRHGLIWHS